MAKVAETPINASITLTGFGWGTRIDMACSYGDWGQSGNTPPQNLAMVVVGRDGSHTEIATWLGLSGATALPSGTHLDAEGRNRCGATGFVRQRKGPARKAPVIPATW